MIEDPAVKYKNEDSPAKLAKLETDIENDILNYPPEEIIKIITFATLMESVYTSTNEIKGYIKELIKYPPVGLDLSAIAIKISGIAKKAIDGYFAGNIDAGFNHSDRIYRKQNIFYPWRKGNVKHSPCRVIRCGTQGFGPGC